MPRWQMEEERQEKKVHESLFFLKEKKKKEFNGVLCDLGGLVKKVNFFLHHLCDVWAAASCDNCHEGLKKRGGVLNQSCSSTYRTACLSKTRVDLSKNKLILF